MENLKDINELNLKNPFKKKGFYARVLEMRDEGGADKEFLGVQIRFSDKFVLLYFDLENRLGAAILLWHYYNLTDLKVFLNSNLIELDLNVKDITTKIGIYGAAKNKIKVVPDPAEDIRALRSHMFYVVSPEKTDSECLKEAEKNW